MAFGFGLLRLGALSGVRHSRILLPGEFQPCNPSIVADGDGFRLLVRTVSYRIDSRGYYQVAPDFTSINWLLRLDPSFAVVEAAPLQDAEARGDSAFARHGFEDPRLFRWRGGWWFTATVSSDVLPAPALFSLCRLDGNRVAECRFLPSPLGRAVEKNWMPRVAGDDLALVYRVSPTQIVHCRSGGRLEFENLGIEPEVFDGWSGSSQLVPYRGRWLCVMHRQVPKARPRRYLHAFVEFDDEFRIVRYSDPWVFNAPTIEFCAGLCLAGDEAILGYGVWDREAHLLRVPLPAIERMLGRIAGMTSLHVANMLNRLAAPIVRQVRTIEP